jgi:protein gp37
MDPAWVADIRDQCRLAAVPFFFKQWGGPNKKRAGRLLDGRTWDEMPRSVARPSHAARPLQNVQRLEGGGPG